jgi:hypothetical protein
VDRKAIEVGDQLHAGTPRDACKTIYWRGR